jgi:hypothetical protein
MSRSGGGGGSGNSCLIREGGRTLSPCWRPCSVVIAAQLFMTGPAAMILDATWLTGQQFNIWDSLALQAGFNIVGSLLLLTGFWYLGLSHYSERILILKFFSVKTGP